MSQEAELYIKDELIKLGANSTLFLKYKYSPSSDTYFVEVLPGKDDNFKNWEISFLMDFYNKFIGESICFVTEGDAIRVDNPEFTVNSPESLTSLETEEPAFVEITTEYIKYQRITKPCNLNNYDHSTEVINNNIRCEIPSGYPKMRKKAA